MRIYDATGKERKVVTANESMIVRDPLFGFNRKIIAGKPVPPELVEAYEVLAKPEAKKSKRKR